MRVAEASLERRAIGVSHVVPGAETRLAGVAFLFCFVL